MLKQKYLDISNKKWKKYKMNISEKFLYLVLANKVKKMFPIVIKFNLLKL